MSAPIDISNYTFVEPTVKEYVVLDDGVYSFNIEEIGGVIISKNGNPYIPLELTFIHNDKKTTVYDSLVFTDNTKYKIDSFLKSTLGSKLQFGYNINWKDQHFIDLLKEQTGKARLISEEKQGKFSNYKVNRVAQYL